MARGQLIGEEHIVWAVLEQWAPIEREWSSYHTFLPTLADFLDPLLLASLAELGVDVLRLREVAAGVEIERSTLTQVGYIFSHLSSYDSEQECASGILLLMSFHDSLLETRGEAATTLKQAGVHHLMLTELLYELPTAQIKASQIVKVMLKPDSPLVAELVGFGQEAQRALKLAEFLASSSRDSSVETYHLLGALLLSAVVTPFQGALNVLRRLGVLGALTARGRRYVKSVGGGAELIPPPSQQLRSVLEKAWAEAMDAADVGSEHILLGLASVEEGEAFEQLRAEGVTADRIRSVLG
jgi:hypothetical protein